MPLYDPSILEALQQQARAASDEGLDTAHNVVGGVLQRGVAIGMKSIPARLTFGAEAGEIGCGLRPYTPGPGKEFGEAVGERLDIGVVPVPSGETPVQHPLIGESPHLDQPVNDDAVAFNRKFVACLQGQRHHPDIDIGGQTTIEAHLRFGVAPPGFGRREVETVAAQRLFELIDVTVGQKHPGIMRFDCLDPAWSLRIGPWRREKRHLAAYVVSHSANHAALASIPARRSTSAAKSRKRVPISTG